MKNLKGYALWISTALATGWLATAFVKWDSGWLNSVGSWDELSRFLLLMAIFCAALITSVSFSIIDLYNSPEQEALREKIRENGSGSRGDGPND